LSLAAESAKKEEAKLVNELRELRELREEKSNFFNSQNSRKFDDKI